VPVEQEGRSLGVGRAQAADDVEPTGVRALRYAGERITGDRVLNRDPLGLEAQSGQFLFDELLGLPFFADRARGGDQTLQKGERGFGTFVDRGIEPLGIQTDPPNGRMSSPKTRCQTYTSQNEVL